LPTTPQERFTALLDRLTVMDEAEQLVALTDRYERRTSREARLLLPRIADLTCSKVENGAASP
jgi:hypothetical protein